MCAIRLLLTFIQKWGVLRMKMLFLVVFEADSEIKLLVGKMKITGTS
jgi:hypothetical protein